MARLFLLFTAISGFLSVALGAFGAHALKGKLDDHYLEVFKTGVDYQFLHALALGLIGGLLLREDNTFLRVGGYCFLAGTVLFSGSLYLLAFTKIAKLGMVTPFGGLCFLAGWLCLGLAFLRKV